MTFQYEIPASETTVRRLFTDDVLQHDQFAIEIDGSTVATIDYELARSYWMGKTTLAAIVDGHAVIGDGRQQYQPGEMV